VRARTRHADTLRRASRRRFVLLAAALAAGLLTTALATATTLPPSTSPLPGSQFQGADGNQDDALPLTDWQALEATSRVNHTSDDNAEDSAFQGGAKEDLPGPWDLTRPEACPPGKNNLLDAWSTYDPRGGAGFLYLGFTREDVDGTTFATFELNQDARMWNNGHADIPCRTTGDVLISFEATGNKPDIIVQRWLTALTDAPTGCARAGHLDDFTSFTPNVDAQAAINVLAIQSYLPGFFGTSIAAEHFGETALNMGNLLSDGVRRSVLLLRIVLDAFRLVGLGHGESPGLRGAASAGGADLCGLRDEVQRTERERPTRSR
jgi:hypothetical protein